MVRKKGRANGPVISLFAFQDIITATTGVLILFILALAMLIAEETPPDVAELTETTTEILNDQLHKVQQQVSVLKLELERAELFSKESTITDEEFKARLRYVANTKQAVKNEQPAIDAQVQQLNAAKNELLKADKEYQRSLAEIEQAVQELNDREKLLRTSDYSSRLANQLSALNREIEKIKSNLNTPHVSDVKFVEYKFTEFESKHVWIVHLRRGWCQLLDYGSASSATIYRGNQEDVVDWITDQIIQKNAAIDKFYVYFAIAPSGVAIFSEVHLMLENYRDLTYGFDLLPNNLVELK